MSEDVAAASENSLPRDPSRFARFHPDGCGRPVLPEGFSAPLVPKTTLEIIRENERRAADHAERHKLERERRSAEREILEKAITSLEFIAYENAHPEIGKDLVIRYADAQARALRYALDIISANGGDPASLGQVD